MPRVRSLIYHQKRSPIHKINSASFQLSSIHFRHFHSLLTPHFLLGLTVTHRSPSPSQHPHSLNLSLSQSSSATVSRIRCRCRCRCRLLLPLPARKKSVASQPARRSYVRCVFFHTSAMVIHGAVSAASRVFGIRVAERRDCLQEGALLS